VLQQLKTTIQPTSVISGRIENGMFKRLCKNGDTILFISEDQKKIIWILI
jgi:hypothetical protein